MPSRRTRIKICGITRRDDALCAIEAGADAIGLVFEPTSPRAVLADQAGAIVDGLPPMVMKVGVFVDPDAELLRDILSRVPLDLLQFHGDESPEFCAGFARPYLKAVRMRTGVDVAEVEGRHSAAVALLLDAYAADQAGGTGREFDWGLIPRGLRKPIVLAGGLTVANVGAAIRRTRPFAVDVSGGVESAKGIKDRAKIFEFAAAVAQADLGARDAE